jgi:hypothetical protein
VADVVDVVDVGSGSTSWAGADETVVFGTSARCFSSTRATATTLGATTTLRATTTATR